MLSYEQRALLLLGVLKTEASHGYRLHELIEKTLSQVAAIKKPTAYATLERLEAEGLVRAHEMQVGNRPTRKVFSITEAGEARFVALLRDALGDVDDLRGGNDVAVMFFDELPEEDVIAALEARLARRKEELAMYDLAPAHLGRAVSAAIARVKALTRADIAWLEETIGALRAPPSSSSPSSSSA